VASPGLSRGWTRTFFLGGWPGIAARAADQLCGQYPRPEIAGTHNGFYDHGGSKNDRVVASVNAARPDIVLVGFGAPLQEKWITQNFGRLEAQVVWAAGGVADFVVGKQSRGPP